METEGRYTLVGLLVLLVAALMTLAIVWLVGAADTIAYQNYSIYFKKQSLDGLAVGGPVKMRGIDVGTVADFDFVNGREEAVAVIARVDADLDIHQGAVAYVKRNLVTGIAAIEIVNGPQTAPVLQLTAGERYPVIAEGSSDIEKVAVTVSKLADSGAEIMEKMNRVLSEDNLRALSQALANLNTLSGQLAADKDGLKDVLVGIREASEEFRIASASIGQATTRVEGSLVGVANNADIALKQAVITLDKLQRDASQISANIQQLSDTGTLEMARLSSEVRTTSDALTTTGQRLSDPRAILFGPAKQQLGPGEKLP
ncbi:MAG: ABC transporter substrate-binding protein [Hydrogenophilales bacterium RIFOXYD1_FULL_62_11]|nr:MAG: ABC transporter substrate-binding protein [Hydrogenophilales bacterium RIFOXYD1_FULL_62_11]